MLSHLTKHFLFKDTVLAIVNRESQFVENSITRGNFYFLNEFKAGRQRVWTPLDVIRLAVFSDVMLLQNDSTAAAWWADEWSRKLRGFEGKLPRNFRHIYASISFSQGRDRRYRFLSDKRYRYDEDSILDHKNIHGHSDFVVLDTNNKKSEFFSIMESQDRSPFALIPVGKFTYKILAETEDLVSKSGFVVE